MISVMYIKNTYSHTCSVWKKITLQKNTSNVTDLSVYIYQSIYQ
uniref:Uncharacterized protein n=1 Tax=Anguilla anguilla TaxID=7936 RepID=A0A0E9UJD5_ANGAN